MMVQIVIAIIVALFGAILTALGTILLIHFKNISTHIESLSKSVSMLNLDMRKVLTDIGWHKDEIKDIKGRINKLENVNE